MMIKKLYSWIIFVMLILLCGVKSYEQGISTGTTNKGTYTNNTISDTTAQVNTSDVHVIDIHP